MLSDWQGAFGTAYTIRQPRTDAPSSLRALLTPWLPDIHTVLEVGCNRGDNLEAFQCEVTGVEPNEYARDLALERGLFVIDAVADNLPFPNDTFDLVFTVGVLIHVPPGRLAASLHELVRVSARYVLAVEYQATTVTPLDYRGVRAGIWKRPYGDIIEHQFPQLVLVGAGDTGPEFDGCHWWMFEKTPVALAA